MTPEVSDRWITRRNNACGVQWLSSVQGSAADPPEQGRVGKLVLGHKTMAKDGYSRDNLHFASDTSPERAHSATQSLVLG